ncbi:DUF1564 domain-containing protein [Leptospira stimsonii]|uniref:DUF1564 domain-containing protein n=1 Tax=Leptospira stimsonii TaxID=2202203 RepID=A0ABY2N209_9LEPT|nr:DUF1564 domain-containing protein [Leptospira stimsonii]TGK20651.1 DUF1564 domain-containing protein [Leptospira stimsonii]TGM14439.1 DUF1564 domain-containing protein [Leptospira stimsonii]
MEILSFSSERKIQSALIEGTLGTDSILIPLSLWDELNEDERRILRRKLPYLLRKFGKYVSSLKRLHWRAGKIKYNRGVGKMKKMSIRVNTGAWALLGALAAAHGVSRCYLFNYMLWLDEVGVGDSIVDTLNQGVPRFHGSYRMIWTLNLRENLISRELEFEPNPMTDTFPYHLPPKGT